MKGRITTDSGSNRLCAKANYRAGPKGRAIVQVNRKDYPGRRFVDHAGGGSTCITFFGSELGHEYLVDVFYRNPSGDEVTMYTCFTP